jgi:transposase
VERSAFKQLVGLYHDRVRNWVRQANRVLAQLRRHGVFGSKAKLLTGERRRLVERVPVKVLRAGVELLLEDFDLAGRVVQRLQRLVTREARQYEPIRRFVALPGVKWIRAATFFAYVDTPWRFPSKQALWRYMGIGLERRHSGSDAVQVGIPAGVTVCRPLKAMILGAAKSAITGDNPFTDQYKEWRYAGLTARNACRNVARSQAATLWGMFKSGQAYQSAWVGLNHAAVTERMAGSTDG